MTLHKTYLALRESFNKKFPAKFWNYSAGANVLVKSFLKSSVLQVLSSLEGEVGKEETRKIIIAKDNLIKAEPGVYLFKADIISIIKSQRELIEKDT